MRCLVTGATGYVGGRLVPLLCAEGHQVRCLVRSGRRLRDMPWAGQVEIVEGDVTAPASLAGVFDNIDIVYYLVHALGRDDFEQVDRVSAGNVASAARSGGVGRIVYLGGPAPAGPSPGSSAHLRSRAEVADIFLASGVPTVVLRAAVIIGSGSASFEMLRHLTERLPVMVTPRWVRTRIQPIAVGDVLRYLVACADPQRIPAAVCRAFDIGGPHVLTYADMMRRYAAVAGLRPRVIIPLRPLTPRLSAHWVGLVTPVPGAIARPLVASLVHEAVCREHDISEYIPDPAGGLTGFDDAVRLALRQVRDADVETRWSNALGPDAAGPSPAWRDASGPLPSDPCWSGGTVYIDRRERSVGAPAERLWTVIEGIGGERGWYSFPLAWSVRGLLDRLMGGVGLRRGRRDPRRLRVGEALDFWRVEELRSGELLRLRAEMSLPGRAWLELTAEPDGGTRSRYRQRAIFTPRGLAGHAYWAAVRPFHAVVFAAMARNIARSAEEWTNQSPGVPIAQRQPPHPQGVGMTTVTVPSDAASTADENRFRSLRRYNLVAAVVHAAQAIAVVVLSNSFTLPVTASYLQGPPGTPPTARVTLFETRTAWGVAGFLALSALAHLVVASPTFFPRYVRGLRQHHNTFRWVEYSISASLMIVLIAQIVGISDVAALMAIFATNAGMILFGWLQERYEQPGSGRWLPFGFGCIAGAVPWLAILVYLVAPASPNPARPPGFVYGIFFSLFVLFNIFAVNQWLQYRRVGRWSDYLVGERAYITLSLVAKSLLAWQVFAGTLAP